MPDRYAISLGEGNTALIRSNYFARRYGFTKLYFKVETTNPTGSYKDRFAAAAIAHLLKEGAGLCLATSSGNTGAALAAYAAKAGLPCHLAIVDGAPEGKLKQMQAYGAHLWMIKGFGLNSRITQEVFETLEEMAEANHTSVQISAFRYSPLGMEGVQTIAYEIAEALPDVQHVFVPAGGGGLTLAVARGFSQWNTRHNDGLQPAIHCVQPTGNNTIAGNLRGGMPSARSIPTATTHISGLQVPSVIDGHEVIQACRKVSGNGYLVDDEQIYQCQQLLASREGLYCEPAGAVALGGAIKALLNGEITPDQPVVCLITGHGFKDTHSTDRLAEMNPVKTVQKVTQVKLSIDVK